MLDKAAEQRLKEEVAGLAVEEILALCFAFQHRRERLRLYLDVLRRRGGERAQFACCLICFDLARQGDAGSQQEFLYLADTMRELAFGGGFAQTLIGNDPYLQFIWELCEAALFELDPRVEAAEVQQTSTNEHVAVVNLLSDEDFGDFGIDVDKQKLRDEFDRAVDDFLGLVPGIPVYDPDCGFHVRSRRDSERIEEFLRDLESLREPVPEARGYLSLVLLFYGTRVRSKSLFGGTNNRKQGLLQAGVQEFTESGGHMADIVGVLTPHHAGPTVWPKIAEILLDFLRWWHRQPPGAVDVARYDAVGRLMAREAARRK